MTITGPGGVGKTRSAIEVAHRWDKGEVRFVELAALRDEAHVPSDVASALGIREVKGEALIETLVREIHPRTCLLVFDNCEHLLAGCATTVRQLLQACPSLRVLATSREPLNLEGEVAACD